MLFKLVDTALDATFVAVRLLTGFRGRLQYRRESNGTGANEEEERLINELMKAREKKAALDAEVSRPTAGRLYSAQLKLVQATKHAGAKCHDRLAALREHRKTSGEK